MTPIVRSYYPCAATCEHRDGIPCEPCNELAEIEAEIEVVDSKIKDLHERHRQACLRRNHVHSPLIHSFPTEIVTHIFTLAFPPRNTTPCCTHRRWASPLTITKVCHTWRALALSTPRLWCDFSVNVKRPNLPLLNRQIARSGIAPLSIYLFASSRSSTGYGHEEAIDFVINQLHRAASLYISLPTHLIQEFASVSDSAYPQAIPHLQKLHVHCTDTDESTDEPTTFSRLKLAIEPPRPHHMVLSVSYNHIFLDWTNISSLTLETSHLGFLPELLASKKLKRLALCLKNGEASTEQSFIVNQAVDDLTLETSNSAKFILTRSSLPSLQKLHINVEKRGSLCPMLCDFLRRSGCALTILSIHDWTDALLDVLENTDTLKKLTLRSYKTTPISDLSLELLGQRLSSRDTCFLPCLQTLSLNIEFVPPLDSFLDAIEDGPNTGRPLENLILDVRMQLVRVRPISQRTLIQILRLQAAGKTIYLTCLDVSEGPIDLVEYWKEDYGSDSIFYV